MEADKQQILPEEISAKHLIRMLGAALSKEQVEGVSIYLSKHISAIVAILAYEQDPQRSYAFQIDIIRESILGEQQAENVQWSPVIDAWLATHRLCLVPTERAEKLAVVPDHLLVPVIPVEAKSLDGPTIHYRLSGVQEDEAERNG